MDALSLVQAAVLLVLGYLGGSVPTSVIVARLTRGPDPRTVGSGRTGGTNAIRALGWGRGLAVGFLDVAKGLLPVLVARWLGAGATVETLVGLAAVLGASRSVFLGFSGGRGVASGIGAMLVIDWRVVALALPVFLVVIVATRYVSLGSLLATATAAAVLAGLVALGGAQAVYLLYGIGAAFLIWISHADNIDRLIHGRERKFSIPGLDRR